MLRHEPGVCYRVIEEPYDLQLASRGKSPSIDGILLEAYGDVDGLDLLKRLQLQWKGACPPVILVGNDEVKTAVVALKAGAADYLVGDRLTPEELCLALRTAIAAAETAANPAGLAQLPPTDSALEASQPDDQALLEALPQMVWRADGAGTIYYWNCRWYEYTGLSPAQSSDLAAASCLHPKEQDDVLARWSQAMAEGKAFEIKYRIRGQNGSYRWFTNRGVPSRSGDGQITGWIGTIDDVDEQKRLEDRLCLVVQAVNGLVFDVSDMSLDADDFVYRSEQLFDLIGFHPEDVPPTSRWWEERIHPDERARLRLQLQDLIASSSELYESEYRIRHRDGHWVDVWERARLVRDDQGRVIRVVGSTVDVSKQRAALRDRNQAELRLREAHIQLESALAAGAIFTWRWAIPENKVVASHSFARLFGLAPQGVTTDLSIEHFLNAIHPDDRPTVTAAIKEAIATGARCANEFRIYDAAGKERWVIARGQVEYDSEGNAVAFLGALADISDRKRIEADLQQKMQEVEASQQTLQALMDYIPEGITIAEAPDVTIRQVSRYGQQLTGRTLDELVGIPYFDHPETWQFFCLDGTLALPEALPLTRAVQQGEVVTNEEWLLKTAEGRTIVLLCNAGPIYNQAGDITGGIIAWRDITELKQTENTLQRNQEHLSLAMAAGKIGSWDWDIQADTVHFSDTVYRLFGLDPARFSGSYETVMELVHPDDLPRVQQALHRAVHEREEYNLEMRVKRPDNTICWILSLGRVFYSTTGDPLHMTGIDIDITDRKQSELTLQQTTERLNVALKSAPITLFNHDLDLRYTWIYNPTHDLSVDEIIGRRDEEITTPETAARLTRLKRQVIDTGLGLREEVKVTTNGQTAYYDLTIDPIRDDQNAVAGITCAAVDISERMQLEAERQQATTALQESEDRLRMAVESTQMGTWDWNLTTNALTWDAGCKAIFGLPPDADSSIEWFFESLHGDDRDRLKQVVQIAQEASSGGSFDVEYRVVGH
ncbi:MAG TPA: PAS domain-containing protein, partial [Nodosilinea sp.]|nr:PAS domain-containing protein [Nodosilinea sp.]